MNFKRLSKAKDFLAVLSETDYKSQLSAAGKKASNEIPRGVAKWGREGVEFKGRGQ